MDNDVQSKPCILAQPPRSGKLVLVISDGEWVISVLSLT